MTFRVHPPESLAWRRIGDIAPSAMRDHIDASELDGRVAFHEGGGADAPQLLEMQLDPYTLIAPHSHDLAEIVYVVEGSLHWGDHALSAGGSMFIPAHTSYSYRAGEHGARLLNIRARDDHSFIPPAAE